MKIALWTMTAFHILENTRVKGMKWTKDTGLDERSCQAVTLMKGITKMEDVMARGSTGNSTSACVENQIYINIYTSIEGTNTKKSGLCSWIDKQPVEECYVHMINDQNDLYEKVSKIWHVRMPISVQKLRSSFSCCSYYASFTVVMLHIRSRLRVIKAIFPWSNLQLRWWVFIKYKYSCLTRWLTQMWTSFYKISTNIYNTNPYVSGFNGNC